MDAPNPWHPMSNPVDLKHIGKLMEELTECCTAAARCMIQGIDEAEPMTGKINRKWLEDEIADVIANVTLCELHFGLKIDPVRVNRKLTHLRAWHELA